MQIVAYTEEQKMLREVMQQVLDAHSSPAAIRRVSETPRGFDPDLWVQAGEMGWFAIEAPAGLGGLGGTFVETALLLREIGRTATPGPYVSQLAAVATLNAAPESPASEHWLGRLLSGEAVAASVPPKLGVDGQLRYDVEAKLAPGGRLRLNATVEGVLGVGTADMVLLAAEFDDTPLVIVVPTTAEGLHAIHIPTHDRTRRMYRLELRRVEVAPDQVVAEGAEASALIERLTQRIWAGIALEAVSGARHMVDMAVSYAKSREQYGRAIGTFQAIKHMCADMLLDAEAARVAVDAAVLSIDAGDGRAKYWSSVAKFRACDAYSRIAGDALQIHGGIGMTWEYDLHLWLKRAKLGQALYGSSDAHRARVARLVAQSRPRNPALAAGS